MTKPKTTPVLLQRNAPDPAVIELLESVLERARAGEVDGVFVLHTGPCRQIGQGSAGAMDPAHTIYNIELWKYRYFKRNEE